MKRACLLILLLIPLSACKVGGPSVADKYRIEARDLRKQLEATKAENAELKSTLATLAAAQSTPIAPEAAAALPQLTTLEIGDYSGPLTDAPVNGKRIVRIYVRPLDARGRVLQITGTLDANVAIAGQSRTLAAAHLEPLALREAYRSGFMGVYYTIDVAVDTAAIGADPALDAEVTFTDAITRKKFDARATLAPLARATGAKK